MKVEELIDRPGTWLTDSPDDTVVSSRVRFARNVRGEIFPARASGNDMAGLWNRLSSAVLSLPMMKGAAAYQMSDLTWSARHVLKERHLISVEQCEKGSGSGVVVSPDESMAVMINEEDHLRIQSTAPGLSLNAVRRKAESLDAGIEKIVEYAFSRRFGYLTACPSNMGTGMRASVMLHLPGLSLLTEVESIVRGLTRIGYAVRGLLGEGTEASGNMYQVSNQTTLGLSEQAIVDNLADVVGELIVHEKNARLRLLEQRPAVLKDYIGRSYGIMLHAHMLSSAEMLDLLSSLRLGLEMGAIRNLSVSTICELMLLTQPGHMQIIVGRELNPEDRDTMRAGTARDRLRDIVVEL